MRVLVTGSLGFAGQHVVGHLLESTPWDVVTIDRRPSVCVPRLTRIVHDLMRPISPDVADRIGRIDVVINLASISDVPTFLQSPVAATLGNVRTTLNLLEWARQQRYPLRAFLQVSTNEVYGPADSREGHDERSPLLPSTPYSGSKAAQEVIGIAWWRTYGIPVTIVNTMHLFGPGQPSQRFIPTVVRRIRAGEPVTLYGQRDDDGVWTSATRNWTYAYDFANMLHWLIARGTPCLNGPGRWNVAGPPWPCLAMVGMISRLLGREMPQILWHDVDTARPGYELNYVLDTSKLDQAGYVPAIGFRAGLANTIRHLEQKGDL